MKQTFKKLLSAILSVIVILVLIASIAGMFETHARAGDASYTTLTPQTGDQDIAIAHKAQLQTAPKLYGNVTTTGTTTLSSSAALLEKVVVNKAGTADSALVLKDGANTIATISTAAQTSLTYSAALTSGTLKAISSGTTGADVTITYR